MWQRIKWLLRNFFRRSNYERICENCEWIDYDWWIDAPRCLNHHRKDWSLPEKGTCRWFQLDLWLKYEDRRKGDGK